MPDGVGETVSISMPLALINVPTQMMMVGPAFDVILGVSHADPEAFNKHFLDDGKKMGMIGLSLNSGDYFLYPISKLPYYPRLIGLLEGMNTLQAAVIHPDTKQLILGSTSEIRTIEVVQMEATSFGVPPAAFASRGEGGEGGGTSFGGGTRTGGLEFNTNSMIHVEVVVNGEPQVLSVPPEGGGVSFAERARLFCHSHGVEDHTCVQHVLKKIHVAWDNKARSA